MTEREKKQRIAQLRAELKELQAVPKSDWHTAFEAFLRFTTFRYKGVTIRTEVEIGSDTPRTDYVILTDDETEEFQEPFFKIFRKFNILEYKNPHDSLNERVIYKIIGYSCLLIGTARHEGDIPADQVTISIFRAKKNPALFREWEKAGRIIKTETPGIYRVIGITIVPFQIVITSELTGTENAACRALTDRAAGVDVKQVINDSNRETNHVVREYYRTYITLLAKTNPDLFSEIRRADDMEDALMEIMKDAVDKKVNEAVSAAVAENEQEKSVLYIKNVMESFGVTMETAMNSLKIPPAEQAVYAGLIEKMA